MQEAGFALADVPGPAFGPGSVAVAPGAAGAFPLHQGQEPGRIALDDEVPGTAFQQLHREILAAIHHQDDREFGPPATDDVQGLFRRQLGQAATEQDDVPVLRAEGGGQFIGIDHLAGMDLVAATIQGALQAGALPFILFDEQDPQGTRSELCHPFTLLVPPVKPGTDQRRCPTWPGPRNRGSGRRRHSPWAEPGLPEPG